MLLGIEKGIELMKAEGYQPASWVTDMLPLGNAAAILGAALLYTNKKSRKFQVKMPSLS